MKPFKGNWSKHDQFNKEVDAFERNARKNKKRGRPPEEDPYEDHHRIRPEDFDLDDDEIPPQSN